MNDTKKATKKVVAATPALVLPPVAKVTKDKTSAKVKVNLTVEQQSTQSAFILAATAVDGASENAAIAIQQCYAMGLHTAYGLSLNDYVVRTLSATNIAKSTVYYLRDIGSSFAVLGVERARLFPLDGLRAMASASKGDPKQLLKIALKAQGGRKDSKPTLKTVRECAKPSVALTVDQMIGKIFGVALACANGDTHVCVDMLEMAVKKAQHACTVANASPKERATSTKEIPWTDADDDADECAE